MTHKHVPNRQQLFSNDNVAPSPPAQVRNGALKYSELSLNEKPGTRNKRDIKWNKRVTIEEGNGGRMEGGREVEEERRLVELEQQKKVQEAKELENKKLLAQ